jgi:threonine synthase
MLWAEGGLIGRLALLVNGFAFLLTADLLWTIPVFTETAGGVTTAVTARLYAHGRIHPDELTVTCITGNGLKTTDCLQGAYEQNQAIRPRLSDFEAFVEERNAVNAVLSEVGESYVR